ncbi:MAG: NAD(P)H-dependent flavin oxidoreductase, partial [Gammaproteobacteria bacterium]
MALPDVLRARLRLPLIAAPMFLVSGPELVIAACRAGIVGALPALNARTSEQFAEWMEEIHAALVDSPRAGMLAVNLPTPKFGGKRYAPDLAIAERYRVPIVITAIGDPTEVVQAVHAWGGVVLHDATTIAHAHKAAAAGVDGINLICGGAGGHAGVLNPFAFVPQVRRFFGGIVCLAGALSDGRSIRAAQALGADLVYMGTRFIATRESRAHDDYKRLLVSEDSGDILYTAAIAGMPGSFMRSSMRRAGLDPDRLPPPDGHRPQLPDGIKPWKDVWSAGQGIGLIDDIPPVAELVARLAAEYDAAN